jgi:hypothetical protein
VTWVRFEMLDNFSERSESGGLLLHSLFLQRRGRSRMSGGGSWRENGRDAHLRQLPPPTSGSSLRSTPPTDPFYGSPTLPSALPCRW